MDYKNGKIYTLRSYQTDEFYIGSTCSPLSKRLSTHKSNYKSYLNENHNYVSSYEIIKYEDAYIELLEECACENKLQLCKREGELIRDNDCVNKRIEGRTKKEYYEQNRDKIKEKIKEYKEQNEDKIKEYREQNRDKIKERNKEYYEQNRDKIKEINKEKNKEYREQNRDKIKEKNKKYYEQKKLN